MPSSAGPASPRKTRKTRPEPTVQASTCFVTNVADNDSSAPSAAQRRSFTIVLATGLWRGVDVLVEPPTSSRPLTHFASHSEALVFAQDLARIEGWPIVDRTGEAA